MTTSKQETTIHSLAELRLLCAWASVDESRPGISQVIWEPEAAYATNGHRMIRVGLEPLPGRQFAISSFHLIRWISGLTRLDADGHWQPERGSLAIELLNTGDMIELRALPAPAPNGPRLLLPRSRESHPPFDMVLPADIRGGVPPLDKRKVKAHAVSARYLEGVWDAHNAFHDGRTERAGVELVSAAGPLEPVAYTFEIPDPVHDRVEPCTQRRFSAKGSVTMVIMPMRAG